LVPGLQPWNALPGGSCLRCHPGRQEPPEQHVPRLEPRNKGINPDHVKYNDCGKGTTFLEANVRFIL
ncbi:MAG TPA: hypothetical protein PK992_17025, partial [Planctomycetaceae bacterium]|nr:hypothetical protein [Planctomycetaceae bacterium]